MKADPTRLVVRCLGKKLELFLMKSSEIAEDLLTLNDVAFVSFSSCFSGFHDWIHENMDLDLSQAITGVEIFPFDDSLKENLIEEWPFEFGEGGGLQLRFSALGIDGYSGGEQSFSHHQYFKSESGEIAIVLDVEGLNERELSHMNVVGSRGFKC